VLGANVAKQCLEARLLDEIIVHVAPVLVGDGVRLFEDVGREPLKLEQLSAVDDGATAILHYAVVC
jgi:riboflavin biosynthesis pyrimidine reductase